MADGGAPEPAADEIKSQVDTRDWLKDSVSVSTAVDGSETLNIRLRYAPSVTNATTAQVFQRDAMKVISERQFLPGDMGINFSVRPINSGESANFDIQRCPGKCMVRGIGRDGFYKNVAGNYTIELRAGGHYTAGTHELMHMMGMWHQANATNALTSYSPTRKLSRDEIQRLSNAYR